MSADSAPLASLAGSAVPPAATAKLWTSEDLLRLPPSRRVDRWILRGQLRESKVTRRNPHHCLATANLTRLLGNWLATQPPPRGRVYTGEAYFRLRTDPETNVGMDVALATPQQVAAVTKRSAFLDGPPLLAVEILSASDRQSDIYDKVTEYLDCEVRQVWVVDPLLETVTVHRPGAEPVLYTRTQVLPGGEELPGFSCRVAELFE